DAGGRETPAFAGNLASKLLGKLTVNVREIDASLLEDAAVFEHARPAPAAAFALPQVFAKARGAVGLLQGGADVVLEGTEIGRGFGTHAITVEKTKAFCAANEAYRITRESPTQLQSLPLGLGTHCRFQYNRRRLSVNGTPQAAKGREPRGRRQLQRSRR